MRRDGDNETHLCFSPDGRTLAYSSNSKSQGELRLVDVASGRVFAHLQCEQTLFDEQIFSPDGNAFATMMFKRKPDGKLSDDQKVIVLDAATGEI